MSWRPGGRGVVLLLFCMIQAIIGTGFFSVPPTAFGAILVVNILTPFVWGLVWTGAAILSAPFAFVSRFGWDAYGFYVLLFPPAIWGISFLLTSVAGQYPLGFTAGLRAAALWGGYSAILVGVSFLVPAKDVIAGPSTASLVDTIRNARANAKKEASKE